MVNSRNVCSTVFSTRPNYSQLVQINKLRLPSIGQWRTRYRRCECLSWPSSSPASRGPQSACRRTAVTLRPCKPSPSQAGGAPSSDPCDGTLTGVTSIAASSAGLRGYLNGFDISKLTFLSNLDLSFNGLEGRLPILPTPHQHLRTIDLGSNSFTTLNDGFFAGLPAQETIVLDNNDLEGAYFERKELVTCSGLRSFSANNVSIGDVFPNFFGNVTLFPALERLSLARNMIWGGMDPDFGANSKIRYLDVGGQGDRDKLIGRIDFLPGMVNLVEAHLDHNDFSSALPDATQLVNLRVFDASYNICGDPKFAPGTKVNLDGNPRLGQC